MKSGWIVALSIGLLIVGSLTWAGGPVGPGPTILKPLPTPTIPGIRPTIPIPHLPDLVVTTVEVAAPPSVVGRPELHNVHVQVFVRIVVKNQGTAAAPIFKTGVQLVPSGPLPFTVEGSREDWFAWTRAPLAAGSSVTFEGRVSFGPTDRHKTVSIQAVADSCLNDEFMPAYCRVQESNEHNNMSSPVPVALP